MKILILSTFLLCMHTYLFAQRFINSNYLNPLLAPFYHGVASGDPMHDRVIIWTRVTPDSANFNNPIPVFYKVATDTNFLNVISTGSAIADPSSDFTVKVDVTNLEPNTYYYYTFFALGTNSIIGRTKTACSGNCDSLRFAVVSCANFEAGFFNVYSALTKRNDFEAVIHLGDYIYEYETGGYSPNTVTGRIWEPSNEIISLSDYRMRFSHYRLDPDLRQLHQNFPWISIWDDHESANDAFKYGAENHTPATEGPWLNRKNDAVKAYFEWMPIRDGNQNQTIYRNIRYGNLINLFMLDTRLFGREEQNGTSGTIVQDPNRQLLGPDQSNWLYGVMDSTNATWKILAQQVMVAPLRVAGIAINGDQWDGYPAERNRLFNTILNKNIKNVAVLTGDIHSSWANDLPTSSYNPLTGGGSAGVEFVTPSVTSPGINIPGGATAVMLTNSHIKYSDLSKHGFTIIDVNKNRTQSDWYYVNTIDQPENTATFATSWKVNLLERFLRNGNGPSISSASYQVPLVNPLPNVTTGYNSKNKDIVVFNLYPNPVKNQTTLNFYLFKKQEINIEIKSSNGLKIFHEHLGLLNSGVHYKEFQLNNLSNGIYFLYIYSNEDILVRTFIKQ